MPIEDRNLPVGTRLWANYKKTRYICVVEAAEGGDGIVFALQGGKTHKSPSSAGMEVMRGKAVNGWRFWQVEGEAAQAATSTPAPEKKSTGKTRGFKLFKRLPGTGLEEGQQRFWCQACQKSFITTEAEPGACPEGHRHDDTELSAPVSPEAAAADEDEASE